MGAGGGATYGRCSPSLSGVCSHLCAASSQKRTGSANHGGGDNRDRAAVTGDALSTRGVCLFIKGDWSEFSKTIGFPNWESTEWPCLWCQASKDSLYNFADANPAGEGFAPTSLASYEAACAGCEIWAVIRTPEQHSRVRGLLFFDTRDNGSRGRSLAGDFEQLGLCAGDKLVPTVALWDVVMFDGLR